MMYILHLSEKGLGKPTRPCYHNGGNESPRICVLLRDREKGRERETEKEKEGESE